MLSQSPGQHNLFSPAPDDTLSSLLDTPNLPTTQSSSKKSSRWTYEEDELLRKYSSIYGERQWRKVSQKIPGKTSIQCLHRWTKILKPGLVKGAWTIEEDQKLFSWVNENGPNKWSQAAKLIQGRSGKQCRERWFNNLSPDVKKTEWTKEEDELISQLYQKYGSSWSQLAKFIPGRTENSIKNRFYSTLRRMATMKKKKSRGAGLNANSNGTVKEEDKDDEDSSEDKSSQFMMPENVQMPVGGFTFDAMGGLDELMVTPNMKINGKSRNISEKRMMTNEDAIPVEENLRIKSIQSSGNKRLSLEESDRDFDAMWSIDGFEMMSPVNFGEYSSSKAVEKSLETDAGTDADTSHLCSKQNSKVAADEIYNTMPFFLSPVKSSQAQTSNYMQGQGQIGYESNTNMMQKVPQQQQMGYVQPEKVDHMTAPRTYNNSSEPINNNKQQQQQHQTSGSDSSLLMLPQRIIEECSSQEVDGVQRVLNLIALLRVFSGQNVPALNIVCQSMASNVLKEFIGNMQKAISSTSTVHVNYIRHLLSIARSMPNNSEVDEVSKRMHYIYVQLSTLENLIENARELVNKISAYLYVNNSNNNSNNININNNSQPSVYGNYKENMNTNYVVEPMYKSDCYKPNAITIRIGTLNSGLEEISKKRAVN